MSTGRQMLMPPKNAQWLILVLVVMAVGGCSKGPSQDEMRAEHGPALMPERVVNRAPMSPSPPIPLEQLEAKIEKRCQIDLSQWRRTYAYTWLHESRRFSGDELSFLLLKGTYADLRPSRSWRDILEVVTIDDRPGIETVMGHYDLKTGSLTFEMGACSKPA